MSSAIVSACLTKYYLWKTCSFGISWDYSHLLLGYHGPSEAKYLRFPKLTSKKSYSLTKQLDSSDGFRSHSLLHTEDSNCWQGAVLEILSLPLETLKALNRPKTLADRTLLNFMCLSSLYFSYLSRIWTYYLFFKSSLARHYQSEVSLDFSTCTSRLPFK